MDQPLFFFIRCFFQAGYLEPLYSLGSCTAQLDAVISLAIAAVSAPQQYVRPHFSQSADAEDARICIRDFRHPCLEMQDGVSVIPNDVHFERGSVFVVILIRLLNSIQ